MILGKPLCTHCSGVLRDRVCQELIYTFRQKMVLESSFNSGSGNLLRDILLSQYDTFTWKMVLKRSFSGDTGEDFSAHSLFRLPGR